MKCLIINGSPSKVYNWAGQNTTSFTAKLVEEVKSAMGRMGPVDFEEVSLVDMDLSFCKGCYTCFYKGEDKCPHAEKTSAIFEKMADADCLILSSPVYALQVSALVKNFFDLGAFNYHRPSFFDKKALVVSSTAGGAAKRACNYMKETLEHWGYNRVYTLPVARMGAIDPNEKMKSKCRKAGETLFRETADEKLHSPSLKRVFYFQLWRSMSLSTKGADQEYWQKSGLLDHEYSPLVKLGPLKSLVGKMAYGMFRKVMKR